MAGIFQDAKPGKDYREMEGLFLVLTFPNKATVRDGIKAAGGNIDIADPSGKTLLMYAVYAAGQFSGEMRRRTVAGIAWLLKHNANPNLADKQGQTPLSLALKFGQDDIAALLLKHGAVAIPSVQ